MGKYNIIYFNKILLYNHSFIGLNDIIHPEKSPGRKKRHDIAMYEQEIRNKLNNMSPLSSVPISPPALNHSLSMIPNSPSDSFMSDNTSLNNQNRPPLSTITPAKNNLSEKPKPRPLAKRMGFKRAVMQKFKMSKNNR